MQACKAFTALVGDSEVALDDSHPSLTHSSMSAVPASVKAWDLDSEDGNCCQSADQDSDSQAAAILGTPAAPDVPALQQVSKLHGQGV